jgi:solute carrier family 39 (zinc transporter), member 7
LEENRNTILGLAIFVGFVAFLIIDKSMRILSGGEGHDHAHHPPSIESSPNGTSTTVETHADKKSLRKRKSDGKDTKEEVTTVETSDKEPPKQQVKASAWLCIISDFTHNITDGLAMSASFYISPSIGAITTMAVFFHEIPHEVGDFAILVQSGFTKYQAISAQLFTAVGAFLGTLIGIAIQHYSGVSTGNVADGLFGTSVTAGDLVLPFTAGGFMYIGTVGVIPELLVIEGKKSVSQEFRDGLVQLIAMFVGIGMMALVSWE